MFNAGARAPASYSTSIVDLERESRAEAQPSQLLTAAPQRLAPALRRLSQHQRPLHPENVAISAKFAADVGEHSDFPEAELAMQFYRGIIGDGDSGDQAPKVGAAKRIE